MTGKANEQEEAKITETDTAFGICSGIVNATFTGGSTGDKVTLPVTIKSNNYADTTVEIVVALTYKTDAGVSIAGVPAGNITYGDPDFTLTGSVNAAATVKILKAGSSTITAEYESDTTIGSETTASITVNEPAPAPTPAPDTTAVGSVHDLGGSMYVVTSANTASLMKAPNKKSFTLPAAVGIDGKTFVVTGINAKAFKGTKVRTLTVKTTELTKASARLSLKGSKVRTVKVKVGKKKLNRKYAKKYRKIFTKKNAGRKASVR